MTIQLLDKTIEVTPDNIELLFNQLKDVIEDVETRFWEVEVENQEREFKEALPENPNIKWEFGGSGFFYASTKFGGYEILSDGDYQKPWLVEVPENPWGRTKTTHVETIKEAIKLTETHYIELLNK